MEKLRGQDSIAVVSSRFSYGSDVVGCVLDFYKGMAEIEGTYASSVTKLLKSISYTFHSNVLMQWLGSDPFEELGTVKDGWLKLGKELEKLAGHHAEKAAGYANLLRQPLSDLLPRLEGMRKTIRTRGKELVSELEHSNRKHKAEKQNYMKCGNRYEKMQFRVVSHSTDVSDSKYVKQQDELRSLLDTLKHQEALYQTSVHELTSTQKNFSKELSSLYKSAEMLELERVNALGKSLQEFAKLLSNTAPSYLECMQRIVFSVADIDAQRDINSFVSDHKDLMTDLQPPQFEPHQCRRYAYPSGYNKTDTTSVSQTGIDTTQTAVSPNKNLSSNEVTSSERSVELPMPVEDHFKGTVSDESKSVVVQDTNDEQLVTSSKSDKIKAFTKKLKFWSRAPDKSASNDTESEAATDENVSSPDEKIPKSVEDEIEAILSTPKKTKKQTAKNSSVDKASDKGSPVDLNNDEDQSTVTDKKQTLITKSDTERKTPSQVKTAEGKNIKQASATRELKEAKNETSRQAASADNKPAPPPKPTVAVKPKPSSKPQVTSKPQAHIAPIQKEEPSKMVALLKQLEQKVVENDYYQLLGLEESASVEDIARRRRERSRELHPDHFMTDATQKAKAEEELVLINQIYTDVLSKEKSRELYNQLCKFRKFYKQILSEKGTRLQTAKERMSALKDTLRKAKTPLALQEEVELAVKLIQLCLESHS